MYFYRIGLIWFRMMMVDIAFFGKFKGVFPIAIGIRFPLYLLLCNPEQRTQQKDVATIVNAKSNNRQFLLFQQYLSIIKLPRNSVFVQKLCERFA